MTMRSSNDSVSYKVIDSSNSEQPSARRYRRSELLILPLNAPEDASKLLTDIGRNHRLFPSWWEVRQHLNGALTLALYIPELNDATRKSLKTEMRTDTTDKTAEAEAQGGK